ncbi:MAG: hypothetical protein K2J67_10430 [Lachnospiraceae bacterium]|nr:hypothetical protein [Lachnospiraceae bacterium]
MTYCRFQKCLEEQLKKQLPEDCRTSIRKVVKNNDLQLDSLVILSEQVTISPNFYLQQFYEKYLQGASVEELVDEILEMYENAKQMMGNDPIDLSLDACRDRIVYHLASGEKNSKRLENVPSIPFLDMVITFHILMIEEENGIGSIMIRNALQQEWKISTRQLFQLAEENTMRLFPLQIHSMEEMLSQLEEEHPELAEEYPEEAIRSQGYQETLVVTNQKGINGAAVLLYPDCLARLEKQCAGDYYILPSSIHELLVLPDRAGIARSDLQRMVWEVNEHCVKPDEILSDHVYHYSSTRKTVEVC